ncbi:TIGR01621 family pseudouridine synthase [Bacterioplanoides sp.]|uniref:TIGR01621 family pseudouridine synthase n=1 Tax=Bacterioplanoides sp. TaxID=2066072 RepID=UPI003AFFDDAD
MQDISQQPEGPRFKLLYQSDSCVVINKPAGISFHSDNNEAGLVVQLSEQLQQRLWPVHRLDKVTSGILLLATSEHSAAFFSEQFSSRRIQKRYLAISHMKPKKKQGWIKGDMSKSRNGSWKLMRTQENPAITHFISHFDATRQQRQFLLAPKTGKTHQLRVAMKSLSAPIDGDQRYGGQAADRAYLHSYALRFCEINGDTISLIAPPESSWGALPAPWQQADYLFSDQ